ncbi:cytochrome oxidase assembly protein ShyY1 [Microbacterium trichothecenolyticum]|uniref:SURF1 family cytochrome oxidase biogenesis protein n=1 Tax=Microbacterium trichothecenolyticum TaxID=69370 RepID=UPI002862EEC1|nr:SURF1 family cytochrome oxidase biogenesis protein [Microbacterium trichothecenolyticum]MDR7185931.1 cytochrome oxidase assembly protein ShyY1 [Microbacterium trichothecenolyticum]
MSPRSVSMQSLPRAGRWAIYIALAVVFAIACAFLSNWQFTRNQERSGQLALVAENYDAVPVPLAELLPADGDFSPGDEWHPVTLTGTYLTDEQLLVRNRPHGGTSAFEVLVPFRLDDGRVLLVDRGWVPPGQDQPVPDAIPAPPSGEATVIVRLRPGEALPSSGRSAPEGQVPTINLGLVADTISPSAGEALEQSAYGVMVSEDPAPATAPSALEPPSDDPGPHLSYAIQWILFAVMGFVFIGYVIRTERRHRREDAEDAQSAEGGTDASAPPPPAPRRRRDRDAEDEDALLDAAGR